MSLKPQCDARFRSLSLNAITQTHTQTWLSKCRALSWVHWFTAASPQFILPLDQTFFAALSPFLSLWLPPSCLIISIFEMPWHFTLLISTSLYYPLLISAVWLHLSLLGGLSIQPLCSSFCWVLLSLSLSLFFSFKSYRLLSNSQQLYNLFSSTHTHTHTLISWATLMLWILLSIIPAGWCRPWAVSHRVQQY